MIKLTDLGEFGLIKRFSKQFIKNLPEGIIGIGDDCAIIYLNEKEALLVTTDMLIEDRHFLFNKITPNDLGQKSGKKLKGFDCFYYKIQDPHYKSVT